jgi:choline dehydrogenase
LAWFASPALVRIRISSEHRRTIMGTEALTYDFVIVGAGAAGSVLANRLAQHGGWTVLVVEAGGSDWSPLHHVPAGKLFTLGNPRYDWKLRTEPDPSRLDRTEIWPRGKVVGGSTTINGMFYVRGHPDDFDLWARLGNEGWAYMDVLPHFRSLESYEGDGDPAFRGFDGPLRISDVPSPHPLSRLFVRAAGETGIPVNADYNAGSNEGASLAQTTISRGFRQSAAKAFLHPACRTGRVRLETHALAERLVLEGTRVRGIEFLQRGRRITAYARREVLLCAGAIGSPSLLLRSGIGPAGELRDLGVDVRAHLPGVGKNLQEHAGVWLVQDVRPGIRTANMDYHPLGAARHTLRYLVTRRGPVGTPTAQALAFVKTSPSERVPDVQIHFMPMGYRFADSAIEVLKSPAVMAVPNVNRPDSRGELRLASPRAEDAPRIHARLLEARSDVDRMIAACRLIRRIFSAPSFADVVTGESFPGAAVQSDEHWERVLRERVAPIFHIAGTCKMGRDSMAVVAPDLRVHGFEGLRVADSSIMPVITSGNTNSPTLMIASRAAEMILCEHQRPASYSGGAAQLRPAARIPAETSVEHRGRPSAMAQRADQAARPPRP